LNVRKLPVRVPGFAVNRINAVPQVQKNVVAID
jgi:hypothetical protein